MLLSNYKEHPVKTNYLVFKFTNPAMGLYFESLLEENNISFEKDDEGHGQNDLLLYGVKTTYREEAVRLNFLAYAKLRKPLIPNVYLRYTVLLFFGFLVFLAIFGYINMVKRAIADFCCSIIEYYSNYQLVLDYNL